MSHPNTSHLRDELKGRQHAQRTAALAKYHALLLADDPAHVDQLQQVMAALDRTSEDVGRDRAYVMEARAIEAALAERPALAQQQQDAHRAISDRGREVVAIKAELDAEMAELEQRYAQARDRLAELQIKNSRLVQLRNDFSPLLTVDQGLVDLATQALAGGGEPDAAGPDDLGTETPPPDGGEAGPGGGPPSDGLGPDPDGEPDVDPAVDETLDEMDARTVGGPVV